MLPISDPPHDPKFDRAIDSEFGLVEVGEQPFYASEILFTLDRDAYRDWGSRLCDTAAAEPAAEPDKKPA